MRLSRRTAIAAGLASLAAPARGAGEDFILENGIIYLGRGASRVREVAVVGGRIHVTDDGQGGGARAPEGLRRINLRGAAAFPGFVDSHAHLQGIGLREMTLNLEGTPSIAALITALRAFAGEKQPEGIISGRGWIETHWPERRFPTKADLDQAVPNRPVVLTRADGHALVANTAALRLGGVTASMPDPAGGQVLKGPDGEPSGMLIDNAMGLVASKVPPPTPAMRREALNRGAKLYAQRGWTGCHNMSASAEDVVNLIRMSTEGGLPIRVDNYLNAGDADEVLRTGQKDHMGRVGTRGVKLYMDGALGSRGAALLEPYSDAPGSGLLTTPIEQIDAVLKRARASGAQVALHAIGDRGNRLAIDAFARAFIDDLPALRHARWRIEHAQILSRQDIGRFEALGIIASMQPSHAIGDLHFAPDRLGPARLAGAYVWKSLMDSGALVCGGSDAPVEKGDPLIEFYAAIYRRDLAGFAGPNWRLDEALPREQALELFTRNAYAAAFREDMIGPDAVVQRTADISIFDNDLMRSPYMEIARGKALMTIVGGEIVHNAL